MTKTTSEVESLRAYCADLEQHVAHLEAIIADYQRRHETIDDWVRRHGGEAVPLDPDRDGYARWHVFRDGATISRGTGVVQRREPPTDPVELLPLRIAWHKGHERLAVESFKLAKGSALGAMRTQLDPVRWAWTDARVRLYGPETPDPVQTLQQIKAVRDQHRAAIARLTREYDALPEVIEERERQESIRQMQADSAARKTDRDAAVMAVRLDG